MIAPDQTRGFLNNNPGNMDRGEPRGMERFAKCRLMSKRHSANGAYPRALLCFRDDPIHVASAPMAGSISEPITTVSGMSLRARSYINRWAPPNENNTDAYINSVADHLAVTPNAPINLAVALPFLIPTPKRGDHPRGKMRLDAMRTEIADGIGRRMEQLKTSSPSPIGTGAAMARGGCASGFLAPTISKVCAHWGLPTPDPSIEVFVITTVCTEGARVDRGVVSDHSRTTSSGAP